MRDLLRPAAVLLGLFTLSTGVVYPLVVTGVAQVVFPHQANGSLIESDGKVVGSELIGQEFTDAGYFWSRRSATPERPYNGAASYASNAGPQSPALLEAAGGVVTALGAEEKIPADLVTSSASGLDPHISPASAYVQVGRVARARGLSPEAVRDLVERHVEGRTLGILGEPRVNVLALNRALDGLDRRSGP